MKSAKIQHYPWYQYFLPFYWIEILSKNVRFPVIRTLIFLGLITGIPLAYQFVKHVLPLTNNLSANIQRTVLETYPDDLQVVMENGVLSTNSDEPVVIDYPKIFSEDIRKNNPDFDQYRYLATIDPYAELEDFDYYQSAILVTDSEAIYIDNQHEGQLKVVPYESDVNFSITEPYLADSMDRFFSQAPIDQWARVGVIIIAVIVFLAQPSFLAITTAITAIGVWIYAKIPTSKTFTYSALFVYLLAISAVPLLIIRVLNFVMPVTWMAYLQGFYLWTVLGLAYVGLSRLRKKKKADETISGDEILMIVASPIFAARELIVSKRSFTKKIMFGVVLFVFFILPWASYWWNILSLFNL